jgi:hypothetical protein
MRHGSSSDDGKLSAVDSGSGISRYESRNRCDERKIVLTDDRPGSYAKKRLNCNGAANALALIDGGGVSRQGMDERAGGVLHSLVAARVDTR